MMKAVSARYENAGRRTWRWWGGEAMVGINEVVQRLNTFQHILTLQPAHAFQRKNLKINWYSFHLFGDLHTSYTFIHCEFIAEYQHCNKAIYMLLFFLYVLMLMLMYMNERSKWITTTAAASAATLAAAVVAKNKRTCTHAEWAIICFVLFCLVVCVCVYAKEAFSISWAHNKTEITDTVHKGLMYRFNTEELGRSL